LFNAMVKPPKRRPAKPPVEWHDTVIDRLDPGEDVEPERWHDSSLELERGLDISEQPLDKLPAEFLDSFPPDEKDKGSPKITRK